MERREMTEARENSCEGEDWAVERSLHFILSVMGSHLRASNGEFLVLIYIIKNHPGSLCYKAQTNTPL